VQEEGQSDTDKGSIFSELERRKNPELLQAGKLFGIGTVRRLGLKRNSIGTGAE
jgi:hypothetical protein